VWWKVLLTRRYDTCTILKFIFSLASKLGTYIAYLLLVYICSKEKIIEERKKEKVPSTST
jgi:hypothetical protein